MQPNNVSDAAFALHQRNTQTQINTNINRCGQVDTDSQTGKLRDKQADKHKHRSMYSDSTQTLVCPHRHWKGKRNTHSVRQTKKQTNTHKHGHTHAESNLYNHRSDSTLGTEFKLQGVTIKRAPNCCVLQPKPFLTVMCRSQNTPTMLPLGYEGTGRGWYINIIINISHLPKAHGVKIHQWQQD